MGGINGAESIVEHGHFLVFWVISDTVIFHISIWVIHAGELRYIFGPLISITNACRLMQHHGSIEYSPLFISQCNNPLTKEPKLDAARRIVPEWVGYDSEIKTIWDKWQSNKPASQEPNSSDDVTTTQRHHPDHSEL